MSRCAKFCALCLLLWLAAGSPVQAKTSCTLDGGAVAFGLVDPTTGAAVDALGSLSISCNSNFSGVLSLDLGHGVQASYSQGRRMTAGNGATLIYNLYANASRTRVLGDGTGGSYTLDVSGHKSAIQTIWGRILGGQRKAPPGGYGDVVMVTLTY
jgi:spore coat protein U-like protein